MTNLQKLGGVASLLEASTFLIGFGLYFGILADANYGSLDIDAATHIAFLAQHQALMYAWNFIIYVLFGIFLVFLSLALHQRLKANLLMNIATAFGLIWAALVIASGLVANIGADAVIKLNAINPDHAASAWYALQFVVNGLGGGNEIVGGIWVLMVSVAGWRVGEFHKVFNALGIIIGVSGILTAIPKLESLGAIFGLALIVWFVWLGILMLRIKGRCDETGLAV